MGRTKKCDNILLSIHPQYAEAILDGTKTVEFRKKNIPRHIRQVVLYATSPVRRVVGRFAVAEVVAAPPTQAWRRFNGTGGISHKAFLKYYADSDVSVTLVIKEVHRLRRTELESLDGASRPPQSFRYLDSKTFERLKRKVQS